MVSVEMEPGIGRAKGSWKLLPPTGSTLQPGRGLCCYHFLLTSNNYPGHPGDNPVRVVIFSPILQVNKLRLSQSVDSGAHGKLKTQTVSGLLFLASPISGPRELGSRSIEMERTLGDGSVPACHIVASHSCLTAGALEKD